MTIERQCAECSQPFSARHPLHLTCGPACSRKRRNRNDDSHRQKRKLRRAVTRYTDITPQQEAAMYRKARKCRLCGVFMTARLGQPNSKQLDHIVPLCMGGTHTHGNVRIVCRTCNLKRPKDGSDHRGPVTLWATAPGVVIRPKAAPKPPPPRRSLPVATCGCGASFEQRNKLHVRCGACVAELGRQAATLRAEGVSWKEVAARVGYGNLGNLHTLAVRHGGLPQPERNVRIAR